MTNEEIIQKGDLYYMESKAARIGRPVVIMSSFLLNDIRDEVLCIPLSKNDLTELPTHYKVSNKQYEGYAICEKPFTTSKELLTEKITKLSDKDISEIDKRLCIVFEVGQGVRANNDVLKKIEKNYKKSSKAEAEEKRKEIEVSIAKVSEEYEQKIKGYESLIKEMDEKYQESEFALAKERKEQKKSESEQVKKLFDECTTLNEQYLSAVKQKEDAQAALETEKRNIADLRNDNKNLQNKCMESEKKRVAAETRYKEDIARLNMEKETSEKKVRELEKWKTELDERIYELENMQKSDAYDSDVEVELETITMERDMYKNKYIETVKKLRKAGV